MPEVILPDEVRSAVSNAVGNAIEAEAFEVYCPAGQDEMDAYQHLIRGRCMSCGSELREHTILVVGPPGILGVWCDGECMTNMQGISFLRSIEETMVEYLDRKGKQ